MQTTYFQERIDKEGPRGNGYYGCSNSSFCLSIRFGSDHQCCLILTPPGTESMMLRVVPMPHYIHDFTVTGHHITVENLFDGDISSDGNSITGSYQGYSVVLNFVEVENSGKTSGFYDK